MEIWIATLTTRYGEDVSAHATKAAAMAEGADYARDNWAQRFPADDVAPDDDTAAVEQYFERASDREGFDVVPCDLVSPLPGTLRIGIEIDGGMVQAVYLDGERPADIDIVVVDYDAEGSDSEDRVSIDDGVYPRDALIAHPSARAEAGKWFAMVDAAQPADDDATDSAEG